MPNSRDDAVARAEVKMCAIVNGGEIVYTSAVSEGTIHVIQRNQGNRGEPMLSILQCRNGMKDNWKRRNSKVT